jgi:hypothetical protein
VGAVPFTAIAPDHAPEAVHELAFADDQVNVELAPLAIVLGLAVRLIVGAGWVTETVTNCAALPPVPVHVNV